MKAQCFLITLLLSSCSVQSEGERGLDSRSPAISAGADLSTGAESNGDLASTERPQIHDSASPEIAVYQGATYQEVLSASQVAGAELDGEIALGYAEEICDLNLDQIPTGAQSEKDLRHFKSVFCVDRYGKAEIGERYGIIERAARAGNREAEILQLALGAANDLTEDEIDLIAEELSALGSATKSPYVFYTANELLYSEPLYDASSDRARPPGMTDETLGLVRQYGVVLAGCEIFKHCSANSLMAKRFCMPTQCAPGQDVKGYVRRQLPESVYLEAIEFSRELISNNSKATERR